MRKRSHLYLPRLLAALSLLQLISVPVWADSEKDVLAEIGERQITRKEILPDRELFSRQRSVLSRAELNEWMLEHAARELLKILLQELLAEAAAKQEISATGEEIDRFIRGSEQIEQREAREALERLKMLRELLEQKGLSRPLRRRINKQLEQTEHIVTIAEESAKFEEENPEAQRKIEREIGRRLIERWKLNKQLFEEYGGRIVFQQAGAEPIDAYQEFLREQHRKGAFEIKEQRLERAFWRYFQDDARHIFLPGEDGRRAIRSPWWLAEEPATS